MIGARIRIWWQQIKAHPVATVLISLLVILVVLVILGGYKFNWDWTGFNGSNKSGKTLWDWLQLLFIPVVLAAAGFWFNHRERKAAELRAEIERKAAEKRAETERDIALDNQREAILQDYINQMSDLILHENLREPKPKDKVREIAKARTLMVIQNLDRGRKTIVLKFILDAGLLNANDPIINLAGADFSHVDLSYMILSSTIPDEDEPGHEYLVGAFLRAANFRGANLSGTYLAKADLVGADLEGANLREAIVTDEQLKYAKSLKGATMPDGTIHP